MRRLFLGFLSLSVLGVAAVAARATTIPAGIYNLDDAYVNVGGIDYSLTGTVAFNDLGDADAADLLFDDAAFAAPGLPRFVLMNTSGAYNNLEQIYIVGPGYGIGQVTLYADAMPDADGDYDLCLDNGACGTSTGNSALQIYGSYYDGVSNAGLALTNFLSGHFSPQVSEPSATPELSSLALLGTGILAMAGLVRRRSKKQ